VWVLCKDGQKAAIDLRAVPGVGAELVLWIDGDLRRSRLYRAHGAGGIIERDCRNAGYVRVEAMGVMTNVTRPERAGGSSANGEPR
jgi:hypothetical protein